MEGIKGGGGGGGGGGGRVGVGEDDMGDGMQCSDHPYRNNPSGICAFCLQEKLGKLVSSSFPLPVRGSSSSSSSPSFRSDIGSSASIAGTTETSSLSLAVRPTSRDHQDFCARRTRIPFLLPKKKKKISVSSQSDRDIVFKRSKSTTTPRRNRNFLDTDDGDYFSPRKRTGFWSFLYKSSSGKKTEKIKSFTSATAVTTPAGSAMKPKERCLVGSSLSKRGDNNPDIVVEDDEFSPNSQATASASSFERKVSRSRSLGCGSRSFSGDFFERISTGFGDCTLRRVESQREGKPKVPPGVMKERVKCGGLFSGFIMTSSSSSSSSSSYWVSSSSAEDMNRKSTTSMTAGPRVNVHGRSRSWGWALASPMRAFSTKPSSKDGNKRHSIVREASSKNTTPDLNAIPSLLAVRS